MQWPARWEHATYLFCYFAKSVLLQGHNIVQIRLIFKPLTDSLPNIFLAYVQCFTIMSVDRHAGMHILKRVLQNIGEHIGDIIPLFQIRSPVHLIPRFGQVASPQLCSYSSSELSSSFWLNMYWTKQLFHSLSM